VQSPEFKLQYQQKKKKITNVIKKKKLVFKARCQWFMPIIPAAQEAQIRRIVVQSQP
jgi:hypothetical protein